MIELGIDEATFVLFPTQERLDDPNLGDWGELAVEMLDGFAEASGLYAAFGREVAACTHPAGYPNAWTLSGAYSYLALGYHPGHPHMGAIVKLSARAFHCLVDRTGRQLPAMMKDSQIPDLYELRPSRIDLTADFIDEDLDVDDMARKLESDDILVMRQQVDKRTGTISSRRAAYRVETIAKDGAVQTMYLGSRKANGNALLRIYDKRAEQIETAGPGMARAKGCADWVRMEASLRHRYAAQLGQEMLSCNCDADLATLIATVFDTRYRFIDSSTGKPTPWSAAIQIAAQGSGPVLASPSWRDHDLTALLSHIAKGSGLYPLLWKASSVWGEQTAEKVLSFLLTDFKANFKPNKDVLRWCNRSRAAYMRDYASAEAWLDEATSFTTT